MNILSNTDQEINIISFSGRKESGKTVLSDICVEHGYEKRSFAIPLKKLVCNLTSLGSIEELNSKKTSPLGIKVSKNLVNRLANCTGIDYSHCLKAMELLNEESTGRDWLQIIGTDIIRSYDPDWHVRKTIETLAPGGKYVFDDTRFLNELKALKDLGGECWFIIRTKVDNISNHVSETALNYRMFDYKVIVNNSSLESFKKWWDFFLENHTIGTATRKRVIDRLLNDKKVIFPDWLLSKFYVYRCYQEAIKYDIPISPVPNEKMTGFVGDNGNPFVTEDWKEYFNGEK